MQFDGIYQNKRQELLEYSIEFFESICRQVEFRVKYTDCASLEKGWTCQPAEVQDPGLADPLQRSTLNW